jgi:hypothetical protein
MRHLSKLILALAFVLSACATTPPIVVSNAVTPPPVAIPVITPTNLQNVKYDIVTQSSLSDFEANFKTNPNEQFYVLDRTNMEIMISNIQEMRRYILSQTASINYLGNALQLYSKNASATDTSTTNTTQKASK